MKTEEFQAMMRRLNEDIRIAQIADAVADWTVCILTALGLIAIAFGWLS